MVASKGKRKRLAKRILNDAKRERRRLALEAEKLLGERPDLSRWWTPRPGNKLITFGTPYTITDIGLMLHPRRLAADEEPVLTVLKERKPK